MGNLLSNDVEATKITSDWFLWIHHTINEVPKEEAAKISLAKRSFTKQNRH